MDVKEEVLGIEVTMSAGSYVPFVRVGTLGGRSHICDYRSRSALDAGLSNPQHWAHDVYRVLEMACREHQAQLRGE